MPVYKDKNGTWYAMVRYEDWQGQRKQKCKRGFVTKREAHNCRDVVVQGNPRVYKALKNQLAEVLSELQRIENSSVSDELLETIRLINTTLNGMKGES